METPQTLTQFGRYQILEEIGRGGQARVYLALDPQLNRRLALKVLPEDRLVSERGIERFRREAETASRLDHPGICTVYEAGEWEGRPFLAMRYVDGVSLSELITRAREERGLGRPHERLWDEIARETGSDEPDALAGILELIESVGQALDVAHEAGLVHRDVKPDNVLVARSGEPVLIDFGLARDTDTDGDSRTLTQTGEFVGTPAYMSPEQLVGRRDALDHRTDVYSLGITLYECLTLRRPFDSDSWEGIVERVTRGATPDPRAVDTHLPRDLARVLEVALERDPADRYPTAWALAEDLERIRAGESIAVAPASLGHRLRRWTHRHRRLSAAVGSLSLMIAAASVTYLLTRPDPELDTAFASSDTGGLPGAMDSLRPLLARDEFHADALQPILAAVHQVSAGLSQAEAEDLRHWVVGSLLRFSTTYPADPSHPWHTGPEAGHGEALWTLLTALDPSQFEGSESGLTLAEAAADGASDPPRGAAAAAKGPPGTWHSLETPSYLVHFPPDGEPVARALADELEAVRIQGFERLLPGGEERPTRRAVVRLFRHQDEFGAFGAPPGAVVVWNKPHGELGVLVPVDSEGRAGDEEEMRRALFRQGLMQYAQESAELGEAPPWLTEGLGDLFASAVVEEGGEVRIALNMRRMRAIQASGREPMSVRELLGLERKDLYCDPACQAQAWALVYYLTQVAGDEHWREIRERLAATLLGREPELVAKAMIDLDLETLERDYRAWLESIGKRR